MATQMTPSVNPMIHKQSTGFRVLVVEKSKPGFMLDSGSCEWVKSAERFRFHRIFVMQLFPPPCLFR